MNSPLHIHKIHLYCNSEYCRNQDALKDENGNRLIHKHRETNVYDENVYCIHCGNWLCGEYDAFGNLGLTKKGEFIPCFLSFLQRQLEAGLPEEHFEGKMLAIAGQIVKERLNHIEDAVEIYP